MDIDLKIGAVFSLADDRNEAHGDRDKSEHGQLLSDRNDNLSTNIYNTESPLNTSSYTDNETLDTSVCYLDMATHDSLSDVEDQDTPPSLLLENSPNLIPPSFIPNLECMTPPVLLPEEPLKRAISPEKKKCTKIAPCYIVLTSIDPSIEAKSSISSRTFKRSFVECSNMCKKVMFRRRLRAGKDVFNVKTPSKQKDYLLYLIKEQEKSKKNRKNNAQCTKIQDIINKHDLKVAARKNSFGKKANPRVRRTVSKLPNDFATRPLSPLQEEKNIEDISTEEIKRLRSVYVMKKHKVEMNSLKRLIGIKRSLNQNLKKSKRLRPDGFDNFLKSDLTSSVSGRVRKVNRKYGVDFAVSRKEIEEQRLHEVAQFQLKRAESESKRKKEEISIDYMLQKKRKTSVDMETYKMYTNKKVKAPLITIENPEKDYIPDTQLKCKKSNVNSRKLKAKALKALLESPLVSTSKENKLTSTDNMKNTKHKRCGDANNDAVLIQDLPKEENVICGFLQETEDPMSHEPFVNDNDRPLENKDGGRSKHLLKKNQMMRECFTPKQEQIDSNDLLSHETDQERLKALCLPETVQNSCTSTEVKQEPPDDGYETNTSFSNNSKVVTVAYSNGLYKQVIMTVPTTSSFSTSKQVTDIAKPSNPVTAPVLVNTKQGLRYLVPNQILSKLPSYSDAIKAQFLPKKSETSSIASMASISSVTDVTSNAILNISSVIQKSQEVNRLPSSFQPYPQEKILNAIPTVIQIPLNNATNSSTSNSILKLTQSALVYQPSVNKAPQQTVRSIKSPMCTTPKQTHTVVHKVSQAVQKKFNEDSSKSIQQESMPLKSSVELPSKKTVEKSKFYLLKIDGKNVLIPVDGDQTQPKAYVVNSDVINSNTQSKNKDSLANSGTMSKIPPAPGEGIRPAFLGYSTSSKGTEKKPTLAVVPNVKPGNVIFPKQMILPTNATSIPHGKSLLQTVTLRNMKETVSKEKELNRTMLFGANKTWRNTVVVDKPNTTTVFENNAKTNDTNIVIVSSNSETAIKTTGALTNVVKSGRLMMTPKSITSQYGLMQSNGNSNKNNSLTVVPLFMKPADTSPAYGMLSKAMPAQTKSVFSTDTQTEEKTKLSDMPDAKTNNASLQKQASSLMNSLVVTQGQKTKSVYTTVRGQLNLQRERETKTLPGTTKMHISKSEKLLLKDSSQSVITQGQTVNNRLNTEQHENSEKVSELGEKSGQFESKETFKETAKQAIEKEHEPRPFKEAVSAREERLRRLKELLKEKQKAVEEIRCNVHK